MNKSPVPLRWTLAVAFVTLSTAGGLSQTGTPELEPALTQLQREDARVAEIFFKLVTANAASCDEQTAQSGLALQDALQYRPDVRVAATRLFDLGDYPVMSAVAPKSPAALAGILPGDALLAINDASTKETVTPAAEANFQSLERVLERLRDALNHGPALLTLRRKQNQFVVRLIPVMACASQVQLLPSPRLDSGANGQLVSISTGLVEFTRNDDELAMILAHELAHNVLKHQTMLAKDGVHSGFLSRFGRSAAIIRASETAADRLSVLLALRAGYRPEAALEFWKRYQKKHGIGILDDPTHPAPPDRARAIREAIDAARGAAARGPIETMR